MATVEAIATFLDSLILTKFLRYLLFVARPRGGMTYRLMKIALIIALVVSESATPSPKSRNSLRIGQVFVP